MRGGERGDGAFGLGPLHWSRPGAADERPSDANFSSFPTNSPCLSHFLVAFRRTPLRRRFFIVARRRTSPDGWDLDSWASCRLFLVLRHVTSGAHSLYNKIFKLTTAVWFCFFVFCFRFLFLLFVFTFYFYKIQLQKSTRI